MIFIFSRRLSSSKINLTVHESQYENSKVMDVRVHVSNSVVNIRYGTTPAREKTRLLRHVARVTTRRAWAREQDIVSGAAPGEGFVRYHLFMSKSTYSVSQKNLQFQPSVQEQQSVWLPFMFHGCIFYNSNWNSPFKQILISIYFFVSFISCILFQKILRFFLTKLASYIE